MHKVENLSLANCGAWGLAIHDARSSLITLVGRHSTKLRTSDLDSEWEVCLRVLVISWQSIRLTSTSIFCCHPNTTGQHRNRRQTTVERCDWPIVNEQHLIVTLCPRIRPSDTPKDLITCTACSYKETSAATVIEEMFLAILFNWNGEEL